MRPIAPLTALLIALLAGTAQAQVELSSGAVGEAGSVVFVPAFHGAPTLDVGYETRFPRALGDDTPWATGAVSAGLGYLAYVDGHGRWGLGGALRGALSIDPLLPGRVNFTRLDLQLESRWRFQNRTFAHAAVTTHVEIGALLPEDDTLDPELRWAVMIGSGPGMLFNSHPFLFGELLAQVGIEAIHRPGGPIYAVIAGVRLRFEYGIRGRALRPCEYAPMEYGECE